ncbi:EF-P 5-aminopentanol modification-associated protein YfmH [Paenibacillus sp. GCM10012307]|uniref:Insulinase family protein n=1 Tax=Paenibacillus roseus TaxID=2798579 RepID=A0A934JA52_9BACL|nr:pitrilysin family protein [Paenibacillus roseus]MBJ6363441.1 insulinase family protein [Paenibacillus roseus]
MQQLYYPHIKETLHYEVMPSGLQVYILPKEEFQKTYATFSTRFGSIDNRFSVGDGPVNQVLDGIAHFLEHKMFEEPTGDIFATFASQGASANAFTSFDRTVYLFSATEKVPENLQTLLDFVQHPYFTDENVNKEKGIIEQEINMYKDNPDWQVYTGLIDALYHKHPVHIDIAGSVDSIMQIDKESLYACYNTFYHPSNMILFVVGGIDPEQIMGLVRENQQRKSFEQLGEINRFFEAEPTSVKLRKKQISLPVSLPKCLIGIKDKELSEKPDELQRRDIVTKLMLDAIFGPSSVLYQSLYDDQLISDSFGYEFNSGSGYAFSIIGGETRSPDELLGRIQKAVNDLLQQGIESDAFERTRRKRIGGYLRMLNSPESIANEFTRHKFRGGDLFELLEIYETVTLEEINARLRQHFDWEQAAVSIVSKEQE